MITSSVAKGLANTKGENLKYDVAVLSVDYDRLTRKRPLGKFSFQRRDNTPFSENKYFSDAPLPTDGHLQLLEQFEKDLSRK